MVIKLKDKEFEFDIYDADTAEKYEKGIAKIQEECENIGTELSASESIRAQCNIVFEFIDGLLGEGAAKDIFGERTNLTECLDVFDELVKYADEQKKAMLERSKKYTAMTKKRR